ncbi:AAA family ATPase [Shimia marina]|uniref:Cell division inhibitor MinD n=1 Tax=Shimia marina TaxID=321267 RepID=A0A0P1EPM1_9RHOB|nr:AAA family ATPase [Shimia marina]CUH52283.1 Cell division inhibitor MinD [Shimia marina]SFE07554.1 pilus assembly protein CpaE [Shimia marina]
MGSEALQADQSQILACTVCRDVQNFELLIVDMEEALGEQWGDLGLEDAVPFMEQPDAEHLEFIALAIDDMDEDALDDLTEIITEARNRNIRTLLIAEDVTPASLHHLLRNGADEFIPYPLPPGELQAAIEKIRIRANTPEPSQAPQVKLAANEESREGVVIAVHGLAGGTGATTLATNLGWELATISKTPPSVCLLDLDLQFGTMSTYLDLPRPESVFELITDTESMDSESFGQALQTYEEKLHVLTAPSDIIPLDLIGPEDVERVIEMARKHYDYVIVDMPSTLVQWSEVVLQAAHVYFATMEIDMRSAQNAMRLKRALQAEDLPFEKLRYVMNRAPKFTDLAGKSRVKRLAESLSIGIDLHLPDGGKQVLQAADHGQPLAVAAAKNPLRKEIAKLANSLHALDQSDDKAA